MTERIRVVYLSSAEYTGGAEHYIELLAGHLDRRGFDPALVTLGSPGIEGLRDAARAKGVPVIDVSWPSTFSAAGCGRLRRAIDGLRPQVVHCNLPGPFDCRYGLPAVCARMAGVRAVVTTEHLPMVPSFARARMLRALSAGSIDRVITVSRDNVGHLERNHRVDPAKIRVVYNGIPDPGPPSFGRRNGRTVRILMAGSVEGRKGHDTMIAALGRLDGRYRLVIAGEGPDRERIASLVSASGLGDRVELLGPRDDIPSLMAASDILAVPSLLEATPYVILEAMAAGRAVIASGIFGIPELVKDGVTGLLVPPGDPEALAAAVLTIGERSAVSEAMGRAGRAAFEDRFTIARCVAGTVAVYSELL